jgi:hypothetical protein
LPVKVIYEWLTSKEVLTTEEELGAFIAGFRSSRYQSSSATAATLTYRDFLEFLVLPIKKEKLRDKVLKKSGLKRTESLKQKKKLDSDAASTSGVSAVSKDTTNSVERRKEEAAAKISVDFAMAQVFE